MKYSSMRNELEKIALSRSKILAGVYKGLRGRKTLAGRAVDPTKALHQAREISLYARTGQRPRALQRLRKLQVAAPTRPTMGGPMKAIGMRSAPMPRVGVAA